MQQAILIAQIILSAMLIGAILLQSQGSGLGSTWGGGGETYHTRRGLEKVLFYFTIFGITLFIILSIAVFMV
jgi:protein translocase SecG subunit